MSILNRKCKLLIWLFIFMVKAGHADSGFSFISIPLLTHITEGDIYAVNSNSYIDITYSISNVSIFLPNAELDMKCSEVSSSGYCQYAVMAPTKTEGGSPRAYTVASVIVSGDTTFRELMARAASEIVSGTRSNLNPVGNAYMPRPGCYWSQVDSFQNGYAPNRWTIAQIEAAKLQGVPKLSEALSGCVITQPGNDYCTMLTPELDFDFKTSIMHKWSSVPEITKNVDVWCSANIAYTLALITGGSELPLSNGAYASVTVDGSPLDKITFSGRAGDVSTHSIALSGKGEPKVSGSFYGASALLISYP